MRVATESISGVRWLVLVAVGLGAIVLGSTTFARADVVLPEEYAASTIAVGLSDGRDIVATPDGRILIALGGGDVRVLKNDTLLATPMLTLSVGDRAQEGLHGLALDENFADNGFLYAVYTPAGSNRNRVSRFTVVGDVANPASEQPILDLPRMFGAISHYGAAIVDNGDGTLLVTVGDHEVTSNGQDTSTRTGSILRIRKNGTIPGDNPFVDTAGVDNAIFAYGFRNPWQIARSSAGVVSVSDVGASSWEELNLLTNGGNYGWAVAEGAGGPGEEPLFTYPHFGQVAGAQFEGCAITGSTFYEPDVVQLPSRFVGHLFVGDLCGGWIAAIDPDTGNIEPFASGFDSLADMAANPANGALYVLDRKLADGRSGISKIEFVGPDVTLRITSQPTSQRLAIGQRASFFVAAIGQGDLEYRWQRNGVDLPGQTAPLLEIPSVSPADDGAQYRAVVTDELGSVTSSVAEVIVTSNNAPEPQISDPVVGSTYGGGQDIVIRGSATDVEDGSVPVSALRWEVRLNHDDHDHGFTGELSGVDELTITIPTTGETSANVWYTVYLQAVDSDGATTTITRRIDPRVVSLSLMTSPSGGVLNVDGPPMNTPLTISGVEGVERTVRASVVQELAGVPHGFVSWSDGGAVEHTFSTPATDLELTASYAPLPFDGVGAPRCQVVRIADNAVITFSGDIPGTVNLLRNNKWIQTVTGFDLYLDPESASPADTFDIRVRGGGATTDYRCSAEQWPPDGPPPPPPDATCTGTTNNNTTTLTFTNTQGLSANLLRNGDWIANVRDLTTYTDTPAATNYTLRLRPGGTITDITCTLDQG